MDSVGARTRGELVRLMASTNYPIHNTPTTATCNKTNVGPENTNNREKKAEIFVWNLKYKKIYKTHDAMKPNETTNNKCSKLTEIKGKENMQFRISPYPPQHPIMITHSLQLYEVLLGSQKQVC